MAIPVRDNNFKRINDRVTKNGFDHINRQILGLAKNTGGANSGSRYVPLRKIIKSTASTDSIIFPILPKYSGFSISWSNLLFSTSAYMYFSAYKRDGSLLGVSYLTWSHRYDDPFDYHTFGHSESSTLIPLVRDFGFVSGYDPYSNGDITINYISGERMFVFGQSITATPRPTELRLDRILFHGVQKDIEDVYSIKLYFLPSSTGFKGTFRLYGIEDGF